MERITLVADLPLFSSRSFIHPSSSSWVTSFIVLTSARDSFYDWISATCRHHARSCHFIISLLINNLLLSLLFLFIFRFIYYLLNNLLMLSSLIINIAITLILKSIIRYHLYWEFLRLIPRSTDSSCDRIT